MAEKKMSSSRRNHLKSLLLQIGQALLAEEAEEAEKEKMKHVEERCPPLSIPGCTQELQYTQVSECLLCQIEDLKLKVQDLNGKFKKPALKKVRMSADALLAALLGSQHKVSMDLRANLKQVKKEVKEEEKATGDWRKNVENKAGMGGRKKMFETES
ncbi:troponin I, fast skeletal muscle-like [Etheostoma cragini]|uniref:troponin I, fast skeletal muscle-like n=1 Tax=Etheostoma cragini TaxID=417921 RepID=UPI00155F4584|nr:troponin I, fast skeletal muscle-like [Etheostoma cragini]